MSGSFLGAGKSAASVEAVFGVKDNARVHAFLAQQQLPDEEDTLGLSREINESGRSVCRINGVLVASSIVKQLSAYLIDIYGQRRSSVAFKQRQSLAVSRCERRNGKDRRNDGGTRRTLSKNRSDARAPS